MEYINFSNQFISIYQHASDMSNINNTCPRNRLGINRHKLYKISLDNM